MDIHKIKNILWQEVVNSQEFKEDTKTFYVASAVLDHKGRILSIAANSERKTHPLMKIYSEAIGGKHKIYLHAEIAALVKNRGDAESIIVIRVTRHKTLALAKPCPICQMAIEKAGIQRIYYTDIDGDLVIAA